MIVLHNTPTLILILCVGALINFSFLHRLVGKDDGIILSQQNQYHSPLRIELERQKWKSENYNNRAPIRQEEPNTKSFGLRGEAKRDSNPVTTKQDALEDRKKKPAAIYGGQKVDLELLRDDNMPVSDVKQNIDTSETTANKLHNQTISSSPCLNTDFQPVHSKSVWTIITGNDSGYLSSAIKLGQSLVENIHNDDEGSDPVDVDLVVMELKTKPLSKHTWEQLHKVGKWQQRCLVDRIAPLDEEEIRSDRFIDQFTKLHVWGMTMYETLLFLDSDTLVRGPIDELLQTNLTELDLPIGVAYDFRPNRNWLPTFNMGVFLIHPNVTTYHWLLERQRDPNLHYLRGMSEQGLLNRLYSGSDKWFDIGFKYNANTWIYDEDRTYWDEHEAFFRNLPS